MRRALLLAILTLLAATTGCGLFGSQEEADIQVYSARQYDLEQAFEEFTAETGLTVEFLYGDDAELLERLKAEGEGSPADVFMTVDAGALWNAAEQDLLAPASSPAIENAVPADLRDPQGRWFGLSVRARTVVFNPGTVDPSEFDAANTYAGLGDPKWRGRLCMRDDSGSYTQALVASLIDLLGRDRALGVVESWVANDVEVMSSDIDVLEAIDAGRCDAGITNTYYLSRKLSEEPDFNVEPFWASQKGAGTHVNLSGAGVVDASDARPKARRLIEWLATDGQSAFVDGNYELPVNPEIEPDPLVSKFGSFDRMPVDAAAYGSLSDDALEVMDEAGYR